MEGIKKLVASCSQAVKDSHKAPLFQLPERLTAAKIFQVYDADSCRFTIDFHGVPTSWKSRVRHINSAEIKTKCPVEKKLALEARDFARELMDEKIVAVLPHKTDLYGRVLVDIFLESGASLADVVLEQKLAWPYEGTRKFGDIELDENDTYCECCQGSEKARKNCKMWRTLREERDLFVNQN